MDTLNNDGHSSLERFGLLVLLGVLFAFGLFDHSLWSSNDSREGAMIADMYRSGTWVTPVLNGENYLEKPPLLHWTSLLFCHLFGKVNEGLLRLPAALYGFGAVLIAFLWGRKLGRERAGLAAAFMCGTAILYLEYSKVVLTDTTLTFMTMFSLYLFWEAYTAETKKTARYAAFLVVSALSFYAKGLLGPGFVWVSVTLFLLYSRKWKLLLGLGFAFVPIFAALLAPWVWALWKTGGNEFLTTVFWANQFGRFFSFSNQDLPKDPYFVHKEPIYYYLKALPVSLLPWTLLVPPALLYWFRKERGLDSPLHVFLRFCLLSMVLILHASTAKVSYYALPMFPILFLMTAIWSEDIMEDRNSRVGNWAIWLTTGIVTFISLLIPIAYIIILVLPQALFNRYTHGVDILRVAGTQSTYAGLAMAIVSIVLLVISARELWLRYREGSYAQAWLSVPAVMTVLLILNAETIIPAYDFQRTYKPFARMVRHEKDKGVKIALANQEEAYIGALTFYMKSRIQIVKTPDEFREFLLSSSIPSGIIVKTDELKKWLMTLPECSFQVLKSDHKGYKCDYFRLILHDPKAPKMLLQMNAPAKQSPAPAPAKTP